jgi:MFS family permease
MSSNSISNPRGTIYTKNFLLLCVSNILFFSSFNMIVAELPSYLESLGGGEYKGLIIALFTLTAALSRPFSGRLADRIGRIRVMVFGAVICCVVALLYPILTSVAGFLFLRFLHGFSTGFTPTGIAAYVADIIPGHRRGEAIGVLGFCGNVGMALGPALGSSLANGTSMNALFYTSSGVALLSVLVISGLKESLPNRQRFKWSQLKVTRADWFDIRVLAPSLVMAFSLFSFGVLLTLIPDFSDELKITNRGMVFTYMVVASMTVRLLGGRLSDIFGRVAVLRLSVLVQIVAMTCLALSSTEPQLLWSAAIYGLASGFITPTLFAWTIDLTDDTTRGRGLSSVFISLEVGIGMGALSSGWIYDGSFATLGYAFGVAALMALGALTYLLFPHPSGQVRRRGKSKAE